jgi:NADH-quinone oxidoreductase subunit A
MLFEYVVLLKYFFLCFSLSFILFFVSFILVYQAPDIEKLSAYECGFNPYGDARHKFEIKFYLVGILFIIFDLEIIFLFPWLISFYSLNVYGVYVMFFFLLILTLVLFTNY